jgi:2-polyprenyl-3-methyl-5-hydroxy-6-metoxy-1,4-benzoquinol methylase
MNWLEVSKNPVDSNVHNFLLQELRKKSIPTDDFLKLIKDFVCDRHVLDIGVVEHNFTHISSERWKHRKIKNWAKEVVGVDILEDEVNFLNKNGFDVRLIDATSSEYLGIKFERVVIGDVIEHVDNPVKLLEFAARHVCEGGSIMVSTPNPFFFKFFLRTLKERTFIANAEHISWITPSMALEIARRSNLILDRYHPLMGNPKSIFKRILKKMLQLIIPENSEIYAGTYVYIFKK